MLAIRRSILMLVAGAAVLAPLKAAAMQRVPWERIEPGLEVARFDSRARQVSSGGDLVVVRIDPGLRRLGVLGPGPETGGEGLTMPDWCRSFDLSVAINAGMYQADHATHVGFAQVDGQVINSGVNDYQSAVVLDPVDPADPPFRIVDLDETPLRDLRNRYRTVLQNLRLVKRPGENRWQPLGSRWAEAALGEDTAGRVLLIQCETPWSMHEFIEILLDLPLDLVAAQHLEGRTPARLWLELPAAPAHPERSERRNVEPVIPNILGVFAPAGGDAAE